MFSVLKSLLELNHVHVQFGGLVALHDETFKVYPGEIIGLLGHNGAGKSTMVNLATGALSAQRGTMTIDGQPYDLDGDPRTIEHAGIKVIHQSPALVEELSIADNITLCRSAERLTARKRRDEARRALSLLGAEFDVDRLVKTLEFGERQLVDLARALSTDLKVLFLDEPTGALGQHEADRLHDLLRSLASQGKGIVYVSHRLRDILSVCTRIVILRGGQVVLDDKAENFNISEISEALAPGKTIYAVPSAQSAVVVSEKPFLRAEFDGCRIEAAKGEILGLFGMAAGPQFNLLDQIYGIGAASLAIQIDGKALVFDGPRAAISQGIYYVGANRDRDGLLTEMSALDNLVLPWMHHYTRNLAYSPNLAEKVYTRAENDLNLRGGPSNSPVTALSGGNRQKIVLGRWLFGDSPHVLLLAQPTQGVDVGARADIALALRKMAETGVTVLIASSESDEIELLCSRAMTMYGGGSIETRPGPNWSERLLKSLIESAGPKIGVAS